MRELLEQIENDYQTEIVPITVSCRKLRFLQIKNLDELLLQRIATSEPGEAEFPFWGKIWEASVMLAAYLAAQPVEPGRQILEIGAGMGVSGLFAASRGHRVTLSDYKEEVLRFLRANALLNNLADTPIIRVDWTKPPPLHCYDWIVGSEVVYHRQTYEYLVQYLDGALKPNGTIFLAKNAHLPASGFFSRLTEQFRYKKLDKVMRSGEEEYIISLYAIKRKGET